MEKRVYSAIPESEGDRLDVFLSAKSGMTRSHIQRLIKQGMVTVNNNSEKIKYRVREGDLVELTIPDEPEGVLIPQDIPVEILWEDEHIVVVNKPPGMIIYPAAGNSSGTLMNALVSGNRKLSTVGAPLRPGVVHRLDKDTSGVMVIARDDSAHHDLVNQFKDREVEKHYLALLYGRMRIDTGEIKAFIGRSVSNRKKMSVRTRGGKEAITRFDVVERYKHATLVKVRILTGRTHQIRVHFASIGKPVLGDRTYGKKTSIDLGQRKLSFSRQMLHARSLKLRHPATGKIMKFTASMPEDMQEAIEVLKEFTV